MLIKSSCCCTCKNIYVDLYGHELLNVSLCKNMSVRPIFLSAEALILILHYTCHVLLRFISEPMLFVTLVIEINEKQLLHNGMMAVQDKVWIMKCGLLCRAGVRLRFCFQCA